MACKLSKCRPFSFADSSDVKMDMLCPLHVHKSSVQSAHSMERLSQSKADPGPSQKLIGLMQDRRQPVRACMVMVVHCSEMSNRAVHSFKLI